MVNANCNKASTGELLKCVWMTSGMINYKLCDRQYDCEDCLLDAALRHEPEIRSTKRVGTQLEILSPKETTRVAVGETSRSAISRTYGCQYSEGLFYHPCHFWVRVEAAGSVRVGVDSLAQKVIGRIYSVGLPRVSTAFNTLDPCLRMTHQTGELVFPLPLPGVVKEVNDSLLQRPSLINQEPYASGWLVMLEPEALTESLKSLHFGQQAKAWFHEDVLRLQHSVEEMVGETKPKVGPTLQNGGLPIEDITKIITPTQHRQLIDAFMNTPPQDSAGQIRNR